MKWVWKFFVVLYLAFVIYIAITEKRWDSLYGLYVIVCIAMYEIESLKDQNKKGESK